MKQRKMKFKTPLTSVARLSKMTVPFKMVGDPDWSGYGKMAWANRERAVYAYEMQRLRELCDPFSTELYERAHRENEWLDILISRKWDQYENAWWDNIWEVDYPEACLEDHNRAYHNEYCPNITIAA
jgi:hypothetical protein